MSIKSAFLGSQDWHEQVLHHLKLGVSNRQTAKIVFGNDSYESRIRTFLEREDVKNILRSSGKIEDKQVKIFYFDLETSPEEGYFWGRWKQNIAECQVKRHSHILTASWATNDGEIKGTKLSVDDVANQDDLTVLIDLIQAYNEADVVVTFNGEKFDIPVLKTRMLKWGLPPLLPKPQIDLYKVAKKTFRFPSNSMNNICKYLGYSILKQETGGFQLWADCLNTENFDVANTALENMLSYNKQDIEVTRNLYHKIQGYTRTVNVGTIANNKAPENATLRCSKCGSDDVLPLTDKYFYTAQSGFQLYRCGSCQGVTRITAKGDRLVNTI